ncbi:MAG: hypothetical protein Q9M91_03355 [Candidatus Dojkabacteria bacterium]|nr:hypothetical protein [Candidatus Dojkabacteria bacterium]MDQ7020861.1 hypothetical protein [Candidatus Dojkabacteria bacterium]
MSDAVPTKQGLASNRQFGDFKVPANVIKPTQQQQNAQPQQNSQVINNTSNSIQEPIQTQGKVGVVENKNVLNSVVNNVIDNTQRPNTNTTTAQNSIIQPQTLNDVPSVNNIGNTQEVVSRPNQEAYSPNTELDQNFSNQQNQNQFQQDQTAFNEQQSNDQDYNAYDNNSGTNLNTGLDRNGLVFLIGALAGSLLIYLVVNLI